MAKCMTQTVYFLPSMSLKLLNGGRIYDCKISLVVAIFITKWSCWSVKRVAYEKFATCRTQLKRLKSECMVVAVCVAAAGSQLNS